jgi:transcriptional regulator with XRE-family HTH domain
MNISRLKRIIKDSGHTYKEVAEAVKMTEAGFHHALNNESLKVSTLEGIANKIKVPVTAFFEISTVDFGTRRVFETLEQIVNERLKK